MELSIPAMKALSIGTYALVTTKLFSNGSDRILYNSGGIGLCILLSDFVYSIRVEIFSEKIH